MNKVKITIDAEFISAEELKKSLPSLIEKIKTQIERGCCEGISHNHSWALAEEEIPEEGVKNES